MQRTYEVEGMHCQSCERKVGEALRAVPGVRDAEVSVSTRIATVEVDDDVTLDELDASVRKAGDYHLRPHANGAGQQDSGHFPVEGDTRDASEIQHDTHGKKFYVLHDGRESSLAYSQPQSGVIALEHTFVPPSDRNRGIAESLTRRALGYAEEHGLKVLPECAYVRRFIDLHEEFQPLLGESPQAKRAAASGHVHQHKAAEERSKLAIYWPLLLTVAYLVGGTVVAMIVAETSSMMFAMNVFMGLFFIAFSFFKLLDIDGFAKAYSSYDIVAERWLGWGYVYPFVELALGVSFLLGITATGNAWPIATNAITLVVMVVGTIGVASAVVRGRDIQCGCLGTMFDLPMSTVTIVEDVSMAVMAAGMLVMLV